MLVPVRELDDHLDLRIDVLRGLHDEARARLVHEVQPEIGPRPGSPEQATDRIPSWVQDYALFLLDVGGRIVTWYSGAQRIYGYKTDEATGQHVSFLYPSEE